ncbi:hypothetical protein ACIQU2_25595 [Pseudomonas sp. NPDC098740]|uniref:hypothetical protein n=1 Tax=Pseudomonas sp. NPDC098740 TaxID=3364486 RepID=UPI00383BBE4D
MLEMMLPKPDTNSPVRPAFAGEGDAAYRNDQTPDATKPALGGFCFASYLVGRGNLNPIGKILIYNIYIFFIFDWNTNWNTALHLTTRLHSILPERFVTMIGSELPIAADCSQSQRAAVNPLLPFNIGRERPKAFIRLKG